MVETRLLKYVEDALVKGYEDKNIEEHLVKSGWKRRDVKAALATAHMAPGFEEKIAQIRAGKTEEEFNVPNLGFFGKIRYILFKPKVFFENIDNKFSKAFFFYLILITFAVITSSLVQLWMESDIYQYDVYAPEFNFYTFIGACVLVIVLAFVFISVFALLFKWFSRLFGGTVRYKDGLRMVLYSLTPALLLSFVPLINILAALWAWSLIVYSNAKINCISVWKSLGALLCLFITLIILFAIVFTVLTMVIPVPVPRI